MWRFLWEFLKFVYKNGPTIGFWLVILTPLHSWFLSLPLWIKVFLYIISVIALFSSIEKIYRGIREIISKVPATTATSKKVSVTDKNKVLALQQSIPSNLSMKAVYRYAKNYAKEWASDGEALWVTYYIDLKKQKTSQNAQIFIQSKLKNEYVITSLPGRYNHIEEGGINKEVPVFWRRKEKIPKITSYKGWQEKLSIAIEQESSNIAKADETEIQISPFKESLHFTFYFKIDNRNWGSVYETVFQEGTLKLRKRE